MHGQRQQRSWSTACPDLIYLPAVSLSKTENNRSLAGEAYKITPPLRFRSSLLLLPLCTDPLRPRCDGDDPRALFAAVFCLVPPVRYAPPHFLLRLKHMSVPCGRKNLQFICCCSPFAPKKSTRQHPLPQPPPRDPFTASFRTVFSGKASALRRRGWSHRLSPPTQAVI